MLRVKLIFGALTITAKENIIWYFYTYTRKKYFDTESLENIEKFTIETILIGPGPSYSEKTPEFGSETEKTLFEGKTYYQYLAYDLVIIIIIISRLYVLLLGSSLVCNGRAIDMGRDVLV